MQAFIDIIPLTFGSHLKYKSASIWIIQHIIIPIRPLLVDSKRIGKTVPPFLWKMTDLIAETNNKPSFMNIQVTKWRTRYFSNKTGSIRFGDPPEKTMLKKHANWAHQNQLNRDKMLSGNIAFTIDRDRMSFTRC